MNRIIQTICAVLLLGFVEQVNSGVINDPVYDDFEEIALVEKLIRDNQLDAAELSLNNLLTRPKRPSESEILRARALLAQSRQQWSRVKEYTGQAIALNQLDKKRIQGLHLLRARSYQHLGQYHECVVDYKRAEAIAENAVDEILLWSQCAEQSKDVIESWRLHRLAEQKFGDLVDVQKEATGFLIRLNLLQTALEKNLAWLKKNFEKQGAKNSGAVLTLAEVFIKSKHSNEALQILEFGRLYLPLDKEINLMLAQIYFFKNQLLSVAESFQRVSYREHRFSYHAAEVFRQLGLWERAYFINMGTPEPLQQLKNRVSMMVDRSSYAQIFASTQSVLRSKLLEEDEVKYALGYSLFRMGEDNRAIELLRMIRQPSVLNKSIALQKHISP